MVTILYDPTEIQLFITVCDRFVREMIQCLLLLSTIILGFIVVLFILFKKCLQYKKTSQGTKDVVTVGLFHPYCNAGGGGERVLWCAIQALQIRYPEARLVVYTGDLDASGEEIITKAQQRFNLTLHANVDFVYLRQRKLVEANMYPYFTILGQSLGSMIMGLEALLKFVPDVYLDTMGYAFTFPLFKYLGGCKVGCYVHYPTISTDMLQRVYSRIQSYNNASIISRNPFFTSAKLAYYQLFGLLYGFVGNCADTIMVNSSWTENHINNIWNSPHKTHKVFPPCNVDEFKNITHNISDKSSKITTVVSVGQFRPEKDHPLQIHVMDRLREIVPDSMWDSIKLILIGSCRNEEDELRVKDLKDFSKHFSVEDHVEFKVNISFEELKQHLAEATIGIHTMWNEHFGIGIVELMAAGLLVIAHRSGGPYMDIIVEDEVTRNGFLAVKKGEYADTIHNIIKMTEEERETIREKARASVERFSEKEFEAGFLRAVELLFKETSDK